MEWRLGLTPGVFLGEAESNTEFEQVFDSPKCPQTLAHMSPAPATLLLGQELSAKPFSLLSTNPRFLRTVVLKEDLPAMKDTAGRAGLT